MTISKRTIRAVSPARGAVLAIGMRWTDRLIGVVSTLVLARLLVPADFGVVAMASVVVGLVDTLLDLGVSSALIQNRDAGRDDFNAAWTLRLFQAICAALLIWFSAPLAADYFKDANVTAVVRMMAVATLIGGFENIGIVAFQKNMEFGRDFKFFFFRRIAGFGVTIGLAFWLQYYWAMVIGALVGRCVGVLISYVLHDFRPRLSLTSARKIWSFSQWILVRNMGHFGLAQVDKFLVGRRTDAATMGAYTLADDLAALPGTELLAPIGRILFPLFVEASNDEEKLRIAFCKAIGVQSLVALPAAVGLSIVADDAVRLLLGERWLPVIPLMQVLALIGIFSALANSCAYLLLALGKVRSQALIVWPQLGILLVLAAVVYPEAGPLGIANIRLGMAAVGSATFIGLVLYYVDSIRLADVIAHTWRPMISTGVMAAALVFLPETDSLGLTMRLAISVGLGAMIYCVMLLAVWRLTGGCEGAETYLLEKVGLKDALHRWIRAAR
jgi:lipopolysaccharide exporter